MGWKPNQTGGEWEVQMYGDDPQGNGRRRDRRGRADRRAGNQRLRRGPQAPAQVPLLGSADHSAVPPRWYTLHLSFTATGREIACEQAVGYVEALSVLRPEIWPGGAEFSSAGSWQHSEPLFCGAAGPDGERCADVWGHPGFHHAAGLGALGWGDGDRPVGLLLKAKQGTHDPPSRGDR